MQAHCNSNLRKTQLERKFCCSVANSIWYIPKAKRNDFLIICCSGLSTLPFLSVDNWRLAVFGFQSTLDFIENQGAQLAPCPQWVSMPVIKLICQGRVRRCLWRSSYQRKTIDMFVCCTCVPHVGTQWQQLLSCRREAPCAVALGCSCLWIFQICPPNKAAHLSE